MPRVAAGLGALRGPFPRYASLYGALEVRPVDQPIPRSGGLSAWRDAAPKNFVFSVVLPRAVGQLGDAADAELSRALTAAKALSATWLVIETPATVRPTASARKKLLELAKRLDGYRLAWSPKGLWERDDILELSAQAAVAPVFDLSRDEPASAPSAYLYTRLVRLTEPGANRAVCAILESGATESVAITATPLEHLKFMRAMAVLNLDEQSDEEDPGADPDDGDDVDDDDSDDE